VYGPSAARSCAMPECQIFSHPGQPNSVNKHTIINYGHCAFPFFLGNQIRNVHIRRYFDQKVGIYITTKLF